MHSASCRTRRSPPTLSDLPSRATSGSARRCLWTTRYAPQSTFGHPRCGCHSLGIPASEEVNELDVPPPGEWIYAWAWQDEPTGQVRARAFPGRGDGIDEDEATGAAALLLTVALSRGLTITQGRGSQILTCPTPGGSIEIGGRVQRIAALAPRTA